MGIDRGLTRPTRRPARKSWASAGKYSSAPDMVVKWSRNRSQPNGRSCATSSCSIAYLAPGSGSGTDQGLLASLHRVAYEKPDQTIAAVFRFWRPNVGSVPDASPSAAERRLAAKANCGAHFFLGARVLACQGSPSMARRGRACNSAKEAVGPGAHVTFPTGSLPRPAPPQTTSSTPGSKLRYSIPLRRWKRKLFYGRPRDRRRVDPGRGLRRRPFTREISLA